MAKAKTKVSNVNSFMTKALKGLDNELAVIADGALKTDVTGYIGTGNHVLNAMFSGSIFGGMPSGRLATLAGAPATGKTFFALNIARATLGDSENTMVVLLDSEAAYKSEMLEKFFGNLRERILHVPVATIEDASASVNKILDQIIEDKENAPKVIFILDSLGMLTSRSELANVKSDDPKADVGRMQKLTKAMYRTICLRIAHANATFLTLCHTYESMSAYGGTNVSGGQGLAYSSDLILMLNKGKEKDSEGNQTGINVGVRAFKSRLVKEGTRHSVTLDFNSGIARFSGLADLAVDLEVFKKEGRQVVLPNGELVFQSQITDEVFTDDVLKAIDAKVQQVFKMGNVPVEEKPEKVLLEE